jgi:hypothetical protein
VAAPNTPWGEQGQMQPLTGKQILDYINGIPLVSGPVNPATRVEQYTPDNRIPPSYGQVELKPAYANAPVNPAATTTNSGLTQQQNDQISQVLGPNWASDMQTAATNGDWTTYDNIRRQVDQILNPVQQIV